MSAELAVASFCGAAAIGAICYYRKRKKSPVTVNCWFCNHDSQVHHGNKNCWDCPYCDQYNGFNTDGGYNKPIPAQHDESLNHGAAALIHAASPKTRPLADGNGLCEKCNRDQRLKIAQLAHFTPKNYESEDSELEAYMKLLDSEYRLCAHCQTVLRQTLSRQDAVLEPNLLAWQMKMNRKRHNSTVQERNEKPHVPSSVRVLQLMSASCALALCFGSLCQPEVRKLHWLMDGYLAQRSHVVVQACERWGLTLATTAFCCVVGAILGAGKHALRIIDAIACFVWLLLFLVHAAPVADLAFGSELEKRAVRTIASVLCVVVTFGCVVAKRPPRRYWRSWKGRSPSSSYLGFSSSYADTLSERTFAKTSSNYEALQDNEVTTSSPTNGFIKTQSSPLEDTLVLDCGIKAMKIGTPQKSPLISSGAFGVRRPVLPLRLDLSSLGKRRPLVSPSRFRHKTIAQSSWVAGGLWSRHARNGPQLGLCNNLPGVSISCPVSRAESEAGDDRFSVFSEPTRVAGPQDQWDVRNADRDLSSSSGPIEKSPAIGSSKKRSHWIWLFCILTGFSLAFNIHLVTRIVDKT